MVKIFDRPTMWIYPIATWGKAGHSYGSYLVDIDGDVRYHDFGDFLTQGRRIDGEQSVTHRKTTGYLSPDLGISWDQNGLVIKRDGSRSYGSFYSCRDFSLLYSHDTWPGMYGRVCGSFRRGDLIWNYLEIGSGDKRFMLDGCKIVDRGSGHGAQVVTRCHIGYYPLPDDPHFILDLSQSTAEYRVRPWYLSSHQKVEPLTIAWVRELILSAQDVPMLDRSVVLAEAVEKIGDGVPNFYESVPGFAGLQSQIKDTVTAFGSVLARTAGPKDLAGQYLSYLYGYRQIPDEVKAVMDDIRRLSTAGGTLRRVLRAGDSDVMEFGRMKIYRSAFAKIAFSPLDNPLANWYRSMIDWGWAPTADNWWETVPFSFVVDWFTNIGDYLSHMSTKARWATYRVHSLCVSSKWEARIPIAGAGANGLLSDKHYDRAVESRLPEYDFSFLSNLSPQRHAVEAAALLVVNS